MESCLGNNIHKGEHGLFHHLSETLKFKLKIKLDTSEAFNHFVEGFKR